MSLIQNPLMIGNKLLLPVNSTHVEMKMENVSKYFQHVFVLVKKNDNKINPDIYKKYIDNETLTIIFDELIIWKTSLHILKNKNMFEKLSIISKADLQNFNQFNFELEENNLLVPILNIPFKNIIMYLNESSSKLDKIYNLLVMSQYFGDDLTNIKNKMYIEMLIKNLDDANYWVLPYNCLSNLTKSFKYRKFHNNYKKKLVNKENNKISKDNKDNEHYLEMIFTVKKYVDASSVIQNAGYKSYYLNGESSFTKKEITQIFSILDDNSKYYLFSNLLVSKKYCALVVNNEELLTLMSTILKQNAELFRYLFGYAWLKLYFDESIKKSKLKITDECIFNIDTVSKLPIYPFSHYCPKFNPYMPIMVDDKVLNSNENINGLHNFIDNKNNTTGICNLEEFKQRLNLFTIGNANSNLFVDIEWEKMKIAIGGSVMSACIQKSHPLMNLFNEDGDNKFIRFFNEYYCQSDIDIMFLTSDLFEYMTNIRKFYNQIVVNICNICSPYAEPNHIKLKPKFQINFCIKDTWIINNLVKEDRSFEYIYNKRDDKEIKDLFFPVIKEELDKMIKNKFKDKTPSELDEIKQLHPDYFLKVEEYDFKLYIYVTNSKKDITSDTKKEEKQELEIKINYKYTISSPHLNHSIEIFMNKTDDHMSLVSQFHLPCVRAFYNGENVYMTPSCVSAHMTLMNIDYKYFAGSKDPIEIINKNRMRGFGTWLNETEIKSLITYSSEVDWWNVLYGVNKINPDHNKIRGCLNYNNKLVHPRLVHVDLFHDAIPVNFDNGYKQIPVGPHYTTKLQLTECIQKSNNLDSMHRLNMREFQVINPDGSINPLQKWVIEAFYESKKTNFF